MTRRRLFHLGVVGVGLIAITAMIDPLPRLMWNATASVPTGLYALHPGGSRRPGELVAVAPPERLASYLAAGGYLPRGVPLLKHVAALPGQRVCRAGGAIFIDGRLAGQARQHDRRGRPLPVWSGCQIIAAGDLFLMNLAAPDSLDGRYFGPLPASAVIGRATPLWTDPPPQLGAAEG
jgi:conjugative transfer signal peptidase TraF